MFPRLSQLAVMSLLLVSAGNASAGESSDFPFEPERYLGSGDVDGGRAFLPSGLASDQPAPLVVFLHGTNARGAMHPWLGGGGHDLRPLFERLVEKGVIGPAILSGPTQSRDALSGSHMWDSFDLASFVDATASAVEGRAEVDRARVIVVGHSGAGCALNGGILGLAARSTLRPMAMVAIDICMDADTGEAFGAAEHETALDVVWQTETWPREFDEFRRAVEARRGEPGRVTFEEIPERGVDAHNLVVSDALEHSLARLIPPR